MNFAAHLIFVGDGEPRQHLTELANTLGLQDKVTFLGFVACPAAVHRLFDLLVLPSLSESFSNVVVEAQACGVPVIASNVAGPSEIITNGENGLLFPARDSAALAQAIATLYHAPELRATIAQRGELRFIDTVLTRILRS